VSDLSVTSFAAIGTTATLATPPDGHESALSILRQELELVDRACSRFRDDSELTRINGAEGRQVEVSPLCLDYLEAAIRAAQLTGGLVDPTVGRALRVLGYDRDFALVGAGSGGSRTVTVKAEQVPGWRAVTVDRGGCTVTVPRGVELDLGATAKARCADRAARRAAAETGAGVLVSLGGDVAVDGESPDDGWAIGISDDHAKPLAEASCTVSIRSGGLATSSTAVRRWRSGGAEMHHILDPRRGRPADEIWTTVSVAAGSCLDANIASSAAVVLGLDAPAWLGKAGLPARLAGPGGVITVGGWPER
jgi:thiamine biosynthesis lipoprotein